ncbi:MAG: serine protease [Alphaproteobacteria bacterium]|nr:serine protease [Alphaproteobacteria bacterium]
MFDQIFQIGIKLLYTGVLVLVASACMYEAWRVWGEKTLYLAPFRYERDGQALEQAGVNFARRVSQGLRRIQFIHSGGPLGAGIDKRAGGDETRQDEPLASTDLFGRGGDDPLVKLRNDPFASVEFQAYGINIVTLLRTLNSWIKQSNEIVGDVSEYGGVIEVHARIRGGLRRELAPGQDLSWTTTTTKIETASFEFACRIYRILTAQEYRTRGYPGYAEVPDTEFCVYTRALEAFQLYRAGVARIAPKQETDEQISQAMTLVGGLESSDFPYAHRLAGYIYLEKENPTEAKTSFEKYRDLLAQRGQDDKAVEKLIASLEVAPDLRRGAAARNERWVRPLQAGTSVSSTTTTAGTICCFVRDREGVSYLLTVDHVLGDRVGDVVVQPGLFDGGNRQSDRVGKVFRTLSGADTGGRVGAAIARLDKEEFATEVPGVGPFNGIAENIPVGSKVIVVGRSAGRVEGTVEAVEMSVTIRTAKGNVRFENLIMTTGITQGGDSGAPVFLEDGRLIGMVYAGSQTVTMVMPIKPVLDAFQVTLIQ